MSGVPVVMLTPESERSRLQGFIKAGSTSHLMKPFNEQDLATRISACLGF